MMIIAMLRVAYLCLNRRANEMEGKKKKRQNSVDHHWCDTWHRTNESQMNADGNEFETKEKNSVLDGMIFSAILPYRTGCISKERKGKRKG
jgi:hypothetical protein